MVQILLLNLLIAIFSNTYSEIEAEADKIWKFQRYWLIHDYVRKPTIVSPLTIFYYFYLALRSLTVQQEKRIENIVYLSLIGLFK
jgi:hypothetical protein